MPVAAGFAYRLRFAFFFGLAGAAFRLPGMSWGGGGVCRSARRLPSRSSGSFREIALCQIGLQSETFLRETKQLNRVNARAKSRLGASGRALGWRGGNITIFCSSK